MEFIAQGKVLSKVDCHMERQKQAERTNKSIDEVPLKFGSVRLGVNLIEFDDIVYTINKISNNSDIKEERLILEISYKFDKEGNIVEEHDIINELNINDYIELTILNSYINKNHYVKVINVPHLNTGIKSYFIKAWADKIDFLNVPELKSENNLISPKTVVQKINLDTSLILV